MPGVNLCDIPETNLALTDETRNEESGNVKMRNPSLLYARSFVLNVENMESHPIQIVYSYNSQALPLDLSTLFLTLLPVQPFNNINRKWVIILTIIV